MTDLTPPADDQRPARRSAARGPWLRLAAALVEPWVEFRRDPEPIPEAWRPAGVPVLFVIERYGIINALILDRACRDAGLPSPLAPLGPGPDLTRKGRALAAVSRRYGFRWGSPRNLSRSETLTRVVEALHADPSNDVLLMPVSIFVGRAPDRTEGWFSVLFAENWEFVGRFRRLLSVLLNGRNTIVRFSEPVSLREVLAEGLPPERTVRKISRVLRAHFRRVRTAVIGPDLSHRRTLVDKVIASAPVRQAVADVARKEGLTPLRANERAREYAMEIAADYAHPVVRSLSFMLRYFWTKLYDGVHVHHLDTLKSVAPGHEVVYVPCHRSHVDYVLLSYLLYENAIVPPHIAAGVNLNLPVLGSLLRRGGAFFLRRSFKANALYSTVFSEYVGALVGDGVSIEYFIEGGRSRTGRLLPPKGGMLAMTVRAYLRERKRPVVFQPVYIGYERLMEGREYLGELAGKPKKKESWFGLLGSLKLLGENYGQVVVNFGEPILLNDLLARHLPKGDAGAPESRASVVNPLVEELANTIMTRINGAADVNPVNLLALALLSTPRASMGEPDLLAALDLLQGIVRELPLSDRVTATPMSPAEVIAYGESTGVLQRVRHPLGDVLGLAGDQVIMQTYFRNNVVHLFAAAGWIACCFQNSRRMGRATIVRLGKLVYPLLQQELFLPWSADEFGERLLATLDFLADRGLVAIRANGQVDRGPGQTDEVFQLRVIARNLMQAFERYYIALAALAKNGSGTLAPSELEQLTQLTAQRLALLYADPAPEFYDRGLFRGFLAKLRELGLVSSDADGKLVFDQQLTAWTKDARIILSRELRHTILKMTPEAARAAAKVGEDAAALTEVVENGDGGFSEDAAGAPPPLDAGQAGSTAGEQGSTPPQADTTPADDSTPR